MHPLHQVLIKRLNNFIRDNPESINLPPDLKEDWRKIESETHQIEYSFLEELETSFHFSDAIEKMPLSLFKDCINITTSKYNKQVALTDTAFSLSFLRLSKAKRADLIKYLYEDFHLENISQYTKFSNITQAFVLSKDQMGLISWFLDQIYLDDSITDQFNVLDKIILEISKYKLHDQIDERLLSEIQSVLQHDIIGEDRAGYALKLLTSIVDNNNEDDCQLILDTINQSHPYIIKAFLLSFESTALYNVDNESVLRLINAILKFMPDDEIYKLYNFTLETNLQMLPNLQEEKYLRDNINIKDKLENITSSKDSSKSRRVI